MNKLLHSAITASLEAGKAILKVYDGDDFGVELKEDDTPLTLADRQAHLVIKEHLEETGIPLLSEEGKDIPYAERKHYDRFWLVDPLDGTKEFIKRNGEFTVNIALINGQDPLLGVVYVPVEDLLYVGVVGEDVSFEDFRGSSGQEPGALGHGDTRVKMPATSWARKVHHASGHHFNEEGISWPGEPLPLKAEDVPEESATTKDTQGGQGRPYRVVASRSHLTPETELLVEQMKQKGKNVQLVSKGSSLKICLVAEGSADIYPRFGPTFEWDTAAGHAIALASGASVGAVEEGPVDLAAMDDPSNKVKRPFYPMKYNKSSLLNPWFIIKR